MSNPATSTKHPSRRAIRRAGVALGPLAIAFIALPVHAQDGGGATGQAVQPGGTSSTVVPSQAQSTAPEAAEGPDIVVTGSLFRRANTETPSPVTVLSADTLGRAGITTVADAVRSISSDNSGSIPAAFGVGFGGGSSGVALRGLTVNSTLTLIDGLRTANYPLSDDGQRSFVDLNTVPDAIVDRVEVLKDGASSSYGADAIGGVVNIILKKEVTGINGTVEGGVSEHGDGGHQRATLTIGHGRLADDRYNVYLSGEYQHDDAIFARDRGFPFNTQDLSRIGGDNNNAGSSVPGTTADAIVAPTTQLTPGDPLSGAGTVNGPFRILNPAGCVHGFAVTGSAGTGCEQNQAHDYGLIQPSQTRIGLTGHATVQIGASTQAYAIASYFQNELLAPSIPASLRAVNPVDTQNIVLPARLSNGALNPNDPFAATGQAAAIRYDTGDIPLSVDYRNHVVRGSAGVAGHFGSGWSYSVDGAAAHSWLDITNRGFLNLPALVNAINTGSYNFVDPTANSAAVRAALAPAVHTLATSDLDMIQGVVTRDVFQLPGGVFQVGVGGSFRHEAQNDPNQNSSGQALNINQYSAAGKRDVESAYFELNAPILSSLEVNGSGRYDHYSDGFSHFSPKVGVKFTPIRQLALRGTFSKGFRAPSFAELSGSVVGFTTTRPPCAVQAQHGATVSADGTTCSGGSSYNQTYAFGFNSTGNPSLKPELSTSFTAGAVVQPVRWLSFTVDYYNIKKTRIISGGPLTNDALAAYYAGTAQPAGYSVTPDVADPNYPAAFKRALFVNSPFANAAALRTSGIDVATQVQATMHGVKFSSRAEVTKIFNFDFKPSDDSPYEPYVGTQAPFITSSGAGTPAWRGNWQNTVDIGKLSLSGTAYYTSGYKAVAIDQFGGSDCATSTTYQGSDPNFNCRTHHFVDVDLTGRINVSDRFSFYGNVINLLDAKAPLNAGNYATINYNPTYSQAGAVGRFIKLGVDFKY